MEIGENGRRSVASGGATHWSRRGCRWRTGESSPCANRACRTRNRRRSSASSELIGRRSARRRRRKSNRDRFCSAFCGKIEGLRAIHGLNKKLGLEPVCSSGKRQVFPLVWRVGRRASPSFLSIGKTTSPSPPFRPQATSGAPPCRSDSARQRCWGKSRAFYRSRRR